MSGFDLGAKLMDRIDEYNRLRGRLERLTAKHDRLRKRAHYLECYRRGMEARTTPPEIKAARDVAAKLHNQTWKG